MRERPEKIHVHMYQSTIFTFIFLTIDMSLASKNDMKFMTGTRNLCRITHNVELDVIRVMHC